MNTQPLTEDILERTCERFAAQGVEMTKEEILGRCPHPSLKAARRWAAFAMHGTDLLRHAEIGRALHRERSTISTLLKGV